MYFVVECSTMSAPRFSGCCRAGDAKVLSTNTFWPPTAAISAIAETSAIDSSGFVGGVSTQISLVVGGVIAARTASRSDSATGVCCTPPTG